MRRASVLFAVLGTLLIPALGLGDPALAGPTVVKPEDIASESAVIVKPDSAVVKLDFHEGAVIKLDRPASTVFVADAAIADVQVKSPRLIYVYGKAVGETTLFAVDDEENVVASMAVHVTHDLKSLKRAVDAIAGVSKVAVRSIDRGIVLEGSVASPSIANDVQSLAVGYIDPSKEIIVNRLAVTQPTQVNLRVRVAEVKRSSLKQLGFNWDAAFATGGFLLGLATGNPVLAAGNLFGADEILTRNDDTNSVFGSYVNRNFDVNNVLDALADEGLLSLLAEPNLTALTGEKASFLAGGEFPIPISQDDDTITIEFKQFGVYLAFTPVVLDSGRVSLRIAPEVSELSSAGAVTIQGFVIPGLTVRKAVTTVELGSGQSFGIAGLISNNVTHAISKFPGLGEVPVLGPLFRSDEFQRDETELVIVVTPYLVRPAPNAKLALPTDGLEPPTDEDRILKGRNYGEQTGAGSAPGLVGVRRKDGAAETGFMLD